MFGTGKVYLKKKNVQILTAEVVFNTAIIFSKKKWKHIGWVILIGGVEDWDINLFNIFKTLVNCTCNKRETRPVKFLFFPLQVSAINW